MTVTLNLSSDEVNYILQTLDRNPLGGLVSQVYQLQQKVTAQANAAVAAGADAVQAPESGEARLG